GGFGTDFGSAGGVLPLGDQAHDRVAAGLVEFGGVGVGPAQYVTGVLDHRHLHAEADAEVRDLVLAGVAHGGDLAFHAAQAETTRNKDGVDAFEQASALGLDV